MSTAATNLSAEAAANLPRHVAVIMDGNGRWAKSHFFAEARLSFGE